MHGAWVLVAHRAATSLGVPFFMLHGKANTVQLYHLLDFCAPSLQYFRHLDLPDWEGQLRLSIDHSTKRLVFVALSLR